MREHYTVVDASYYDDDRLRGDDFLTLEEAEAEATESARYSDRMYVVKVTSEPLREYVAHRSVTVKDLPKKSDG